MRVRKRFPFAIYQVAGSDGIRGLRVRLLGRFDPSPRYQRGVDVPNLLMGECSPLDAKPGERCPQRRLLLLRCRAHQSENCLVHLVELTASVVVESIDTALERGEFARQNGMRRQ
jgi:hypothetical protein